MKKLVLALVVAATTAGVAQSAAAATFVMRMRGAEPTEDFIVRTTSRSFIRAARNELKLPVAQRFLHPQGKIVAGNSGNLGWSWHFTKAVELVEVSVEHCDALPSYVEANLDAWLAEVGGFCPWGGYVHAEVR